ncbi:VWA domain-containing protein [Methanolobus mangrovi]|uniref:VWA domain-containing protein n=1 Tax=Methanolobus mangrovi TaxID=3072977 RepID=A0AA51UFD7_9EURY|nr:VWA domain-containing protein [Methanolobus mangrovi]WMW22153.1 VWA domain-containing protein [Methanolobus mangrovi]
MTESELVQRLRRNLPRNYGIKVMYIGVPLLGLRIPKNSVSDFSKDDTEILYDNLYKNMEQIRPDEIEDVYIVADSDHMTMEPGAFFTPLIGTSDTAVAAVFKNPQNNVPLDDAPVLTSEREETDSSLVTGPIPEAAFVDLAEKDASKYDPERSAFADILKPDTNKTKESTDEFAFESIRPPVFEESIFESSSPVCLHEPEVLVELTPKEYVHILSHNDLEEEFKFESKATSKKSGSEKLFEDLKEDKTVGKILNEFAHNSQKKRLALGRLKSGRRAEVLTKSKRGRYVRYRMPGEKITDIAIAPTVRAAAHHAKDGKIEIKKSDIREKVRRRRISSLINIVFDTSGSMDEQEKVQITTSVVLALLKDAYQRRDRVSLVTYSGRSGELVLPFTSSVEAAKRYLEKVPFGGTTPMASGLLRGLDTLLRELKKEPSAVPIMILVTDGTANSPLHLGGNIRREIIQVCKQIAENHINILVVDISDTGSRLVKEVAMQSNGSYYHPKSLSKEALYSAIKQERDQKTAFVAV